MANICAILSSDFSLVSRLHCERFKANSIGLGAARSEVHRRSNPTGTYINRFSTAADVSSGISRGPTCSFFSLVLPLSPVRFYRLPRRPGASSTRYFLRSARSALATLRLVLVPFSIRKYNGVGDDAADFLYKSAARARTSRVVSHGIRSFRFYTRLAPSENDGNLPWRGGGVHRSQGITKLTRRRRFRFLDISSFAIFVLYF